MRKILIFAVLLSGCGPPDHRNIYQNTGTYIVEGKCTEPVVSVVIERNGRFDVNASMGSAFLLDKKRGIFATVEHVVDLETNYKVFFCGKVFDAHRSLTGGVTDVGFIQLTGNFDLSGFPEPYPIGSLPKKGDNVFIRGIHMHRESLQQGKLIHRITGTYYGIKETEMVGGRLETREFVYDDLPAKVLGEEALAAFLKRPRLQRETVEYMTKNHPTLVETRDDHKFSFGGLSGGPTVNEMGEVVGVNVVEFGDEGIYVLDETGIKYRPRVTLAILTSDEIIRALKTSNIGSQ